MSTARIRFSADILRRLGEELNPHPDKGIVELAKNAYDADATRCRIELLGTDRAGGVIVVTDDGDGMTPAEIERGWLVLGSSCLPENPVLRTKIWGNQHNSGRYFTTKSADAGRNRPATDSNRSGAAQMPTFRDGNILPSCDGSNRARVDTAPLRQRGVVVVVCARVSAG